MWLSVELRLERGGMAGVATATVEKGGEASCCCELCREELPCEPVLPPACDLNCISMNSCTSSSSSSSPGKEQQCSLIYFTVSSRRASELRMMGDRLFIGSGVLPVDFETTLLTLDSLLPLGLALTDLLVVVVLVGEGKLEEG